MNVLIIGLGSIAKKHIQALKKLNNAVHFYALRSGRSSENIEGVTNILSLAECPEVRFVIIANPTAFHADAINKVIHLKKPLFIEKPPFHELTQAESCLSAIQRNSIITYTAFNLRFLDCLNYLKKKVDVSKVQEVNVYCGSYLPNWRPNVDYRKSYSANASMGGGVHLDLIHELDYVLWLFGKPLEVRKILRSKSKIGIDAIDYANYALVYPNFVVNIILNYYRQDAKRTCEIVFDDTTWNADLIKNTVYDNKQQSVVFQSEQMVADTYTAQMDYFCKALSTNVSLFNSLAESVETLKIALS